MILVIIKLAAKNDPELKFNDKTILLQGRRLLMPKTQCFQGLGVTRVILDEVSDEEPETLSLKNNEIRKSVNFKNGINSETFMNKAKLDMSLLDNSLL